MKAQLYGTKWCPKTAVISNFLQKEWIDFEYLDVEEDSKAAQEVKDQYNGRLLFPVMQIEGNWYKNPRISKLQEIFKGER